MLETHEAECRPLLAGLAVEVQLPKAARDEDVEDHVKREIVMSVWTAAVTTVDCGVADIDTGAGWDT